MKQINKPFNSINDILNFCSECSEEDFITVDTEFVRTNTFFPKLSLVQIANSKKAILIDFIAIKNLDPLLGLFLNENIVKVFHSGRQDLEIFFNLFNKLPKNIFDTQIASAFLGFEEQISYEKLVLKFCNHKIDKNYQFYDWSIRPLKKPQIKYALSDVIYLRKVYSELTKELDKKNRLNWAKSEFEKLLDPGKYSNNPRSYWQKLKVKNLTNISIQKLKKLTEWREKKCISENQPRNYIMNDKKIINLINFENPTQNIFSKFGVYNLSKKDEEKILNILNLKEKSSKIKNITYKKVDLKKLKQLKYLLKIVSNNSEITESLIATTSDLKSFLTNSSNKNNFFKGWRKVIFGNYANKLLENKLSFEKINDKIQVKVK